METTEKRKIKAPAEKLTVQLGGNSYEVAMPNVGQIIDMETTKLHMTGGRHSQLIDGDEQAMYAYMLVAAIATFKVLIPNAIKDSNRSITDFNPIQAKELVKVYTDKLFPWLRDIKDVANDQVDVEG